MTKKYQLFVAIVLAVLVCNSAQQPVTENEDPIPDDLGRSSGSILADQEVDESGCVDIEPEDGFSCAEQAEWGKCLATWMVDANLCAKTCGRCEVPKTLKETIVSMLDKTEVSLTEGKKQNNVLLNEAEELVQSVILQNELNGYVSVDAMDMLNDIDFTLLLSAAGVLYRERVADQCSGEGGAVLTTMGPDMGEWLLAVQLEAESNNSVYFVMGVRVDCAITDEDVETRFDIISVKATFPNFVDSVESLYSFVGGVNPAKSNQI